MAAEIAIISSAIKPNTLKGAYKMTLGSLFDGIGGWQLAATRAGIKPLWSSEIDEFCCAVTRRHFPDTVQLGDINTIDAPPHVDIITAGSPCQDLSVAGKQGGIHCERSGLFFKAVELVRRLKPLLFIWENVPNVLSLHGGKDFQTVLQEITSSVIPIPQGGFANAGVVDFHGGQLAWRILDAQHFGVPQRRRRIFLVADFTTRRAAQILFEPQSLPPHIESSRQAQSKSSRTPPLGIGRDAFNQGRNSQFKPTIERDLSPTLRAKGANAVGTHIVRRFTPVEEERLMGLPDNWTQGGSDTQRYKALGNAMAQPCADFILERIKKPPEGGLLFEK